MTLLLDKQLESDGGGSLMGQTLGAHCMMHGRWEFGEQLCRPEVRKLKWHAFCIQCGLVKVPDGLPVRYCEHAKVVLCAVCERILHLSFGLAF